MNRFRTLLSVAVATAASLQGSSLVGQEPAPSSAKLLASAKSRLATLDGTIAVHGLAAPVEVRRDTWGVPHIYAGNQHDLFFAQGYVAAQDRLFQMELWRRQGEGRLAEVLGPRYVQRDRFARLFKYRGDMKKEWASYAPDAKAIVTAFVDGVNAYIGEVRRDTTKLPIEFSLSGFLPEAWSVTVPLARVTPLSGVSNGSEELLRAMLVKRLGVAKADELLPTDPHRDIDVDPSLDLTGLEPALLGGAGQTYADVVLQRLDGSNNWVVSGKMSATGKPLLANDPHRAITNPAVRYLTHLVAPGWNVIGAGEPASPGVPIGHNERIAFGLTIVGMDQQDVYVEKVRACTAGEQKRALGTVRNGTVTPSRASGANVVAGGPPARCAFYRGKFEPVRSIDDTVRVRGEAPRVMSLEFTRHGPIVSVDTARGRAIAIRMVGGEPGTAAYLASLTLGRAKNWTDFKSAMARWLMPAENMIYADVDGNIGWIAAGLVPRRSWTGLMPVAGDGRFEWGSFLGINALPQSYNPSSGFVATSNDNILPPGYKEFIGAEFGSAYRGDRVREVLRSGSRFTIEDFERLQHDDLSVLARELAPALVSAAVRAGTSDGSAVLAVGSWDFRMDHDKLAPLLFEAWSQAFARSLYRSMLPADLASLGSRLEWELVVEAAREARHVGGSEPAARRDSLVVVALDTAIADITRRLGADRANWKWGALHVAPLGNGLASAFDIPAVQRDGHANTVMATGGSDYRQRSGASYREILDVSNWDNSVAVNVPGQSGQPGSEHYSDLLAYWADGRYFPLVFSRKKVEEMTKHRLILSPTH